MAMLSHITNSGRSYIDTLRLSRKEERELLCDLETQGRAADPPHDNRRQARRYASDGRVGMVVQLQHPGGSKHCYLVRPRDISRTGVGFLHGGFIYSQTPCTVILVAPDGSLIKRTGQVVRCRFVRGHIHEVGLRLDSPLDPTLLLQPAQVKNEPVQDEVVDNDQPAPEQTPETETPPLRAVTGTLLYVEPETPQRETIVKTLGNRDVTVIDVSSVQQALDRLRNVKTDLVLVDVEGLELQGEVLVETLHQRGHGAPVAGIANGQAEAVNALAEAAGCEAGLARPLQQAALIRLFNKFLPRQARNAG